MCYIYLLFLLTLTHQSVVICSTMIPKRSKNYTVSLSVQETGMNIVCDDCGSYHIDQRLRSSDSSSSSLRSTKRKHINACTLTRNEKCTCTTNIPGRTLIVEQNIANIQAKVKALENYNDANLANDRHRKGEIISQANAKGGIDKRKFARTIKHLVRKELSVIKKEMKQDIDRNILLSHKCLEMNHSDKKKQTIIDNLLRYIKVVDPGKDTTSGLNIQLLEPMQTDSPFIENRQQKPNVNYAKAKPKSHKVKRSVHRETDLISDGDGKAYIRRRLEVIEHDIETLANGMSALHEHMFERDDIKKQFEYEKINMKNILTQIIENEHGSFKLEIEYIRNQTQIVYKLLQTTMKSQKHLKESIQNSNAIFKKRMNSIERKVSKISSLLDALKGILDLKNSDALPVHNAKQTSVMKDTIAFVAKMKKVWPTLMKTMRTMTKRHVNVMKVVNNIARKCERERIATDRHTQNVKDQLENSAARYYFGLYIVMVGVTAIIPYCAFSY